MIQIQIVKQCGYSGRRLQFETKITVTMIQEVGSLSFLSGLCVSVLHCVFYRPQTKSTAKKQLSQKGRKSRKQDSSAEEDDEEEEEDDDDDEDDDTPKRQTRRRGANKVKRCISERRYFDLLFVEVSLCMELLDGDI